MKRFGAIILLFIYFASVFAFDTLAQEETASDAVLMGSHTMDAQLPVLGSQQLITNAKSVILYEVNTDTLMHAWNADEKLPPASFVKVLTALIAIEQGDLSASVTVKSSVLDTVVYNAAKTGFLDGEVLTLQDLLYCMMVDSGNDAAALIADHIAGSQSVFVETLNTYAQELGCSNTNFTNVHGLHDDNQYTTARDMGRIMAAAVKNETFCDILGTVYYSVPATNLSEERYLASENYLINTDTFQIYYDERVLGGRTGIAQDGDRCIAALAEQNGLRYISVIMGSASVYEENGVQVRSVGGYTETSDLLDLGFEDYQSCQLIYNGQVLKQKKVLNGDCAVSLGTQESALAVLPVGATMDDITIEFSDSANEFSAPIEKGQQLSTVKFMYGNTCVAQVKLYAMNNVRAADAVPVEQMREDGSETWEKAFITLLIVLICIIILFAILRVYKMLQRRAVNKRTRKRRQDRRRSS